MLASRRAPESWPRELSFEPQGGERNARQAERAFVHQVARFPAGEELGVEAVEALDLKDGVGSAQSVAEHSLRPPPRAADEAREGREIQRDLADSMCSQRVDRLGDHELGEAVRGVDVTAHERERDRGTAVAWDEVQETAHLCV